ncbi:MAG: hypothetical protein A2Y33_06495 [Spirochaetes bacterium GWF1_51_8]|nr:MAG: hypothetical protein A2Y33_06495 [Spirochaetes bacterium GWF1_51_8]
MKRIPVVIPLLFLALSCGGQESVKETAPAGGMSPKKVSLPSIKGADMDGYIGMKVSMTAQQSEIIHQHMILTQFVDDRKLYYIDTEDGYQITAYSLKPVPCNGKIKVVGTIGEVSGHAKAGGGHHSELYIMVEDWECLD